MGKVFKNVLLGFPGTISRSVDDVVAAFANADNRSIPFGFPVFLNDDGTGVVGISADSDPDRFVGFTVRAGDKTPDVYEDPNDPNANSTAVYQKGEIMDVLTRGSMVVDATGSNPKPGMPVYLNTTYGKASALSSDSTITVPGIFFRSTRDSGGRTEIVVTERHIQ